MGRLDWGLLGQSMSALTSLQLQQCDHLSVAAAQALAGLSRLRRLRLDSCLVVTDVSLQALAALTLLTHLDISSTQASFSSAAWPGLAWRVDCCAMAARDWFWGSWLHLTCSCQHK